LKSATRRRAISGQGKTLQLLNRDFTDKDLVAAFQPVIDTAAAEKDADAKRTAAIANARTARAQAAPVFKALKPVLLSMFTGNAEALADFGLEPPKAAAKTPAVKAAAAAKAKATRAALGTKGPKQRKEAKKALAEKAAGPASPAAATARAASSTAPAASSAAPAASSAASAQPVASVAPAQKS
jgi:hypothetical protein